MLRSIAGFAAVTCLLTGAARAATCPAYPNTLTNGSTADASQVMANFNSVLGCANSNLAPLSSPQFSGRVGIGATPATQVLDVTGNTVVGAQTERLFLSSTYIGFNIFASTIYDNTKNGYIFQHYASSQNTPDMLALRTFDTTGTVIANRAFAMSAAGNFTVGANPNVSYTFYVNGAAGGTSAWTNASDGRLKKNVVEIPDALDLIKGLRGVRFQWRSPAEREVGKDITLPVGEKQLGFIAQEVQKVVPEAVTPPKSGSNEIYGLKPDVLIPILVEAIKTQQAEIVQLQSQMKELNHFRSH